ncbi:MAG: hypothetical protein JOZ17_13125 [Acetobacteraceae bacterium]|nr:hypothetical protein [Acetobacteraceae bacterium]
MFLRAVIPLAGLAATAAHADNVTINVGAGGQYQTLTQAVAVANADPNNVYTIVLAPDTYLNDFPDAITSPMTIEGSDPRNLAVLQGTVPLPNEKGIILTVSSLTLRNLEITGAFIDDSLGGNGAALRDQNPENTPAAVVLDNVYVHDNQAGVQQGDDIAETVTISNSSFVNNGNPDLCCFTHGVYIDEAASRTVMSSLFCGQLIGHDIKSRAMSTMVSGSQIYSGEGAPATTSCRVGNTSFDIDMPNGGVGVVSNNTIVQGPTAQNHKMINYGEEGLVYDTNSLTVQTNSFISTTNSIAIEDPPCVPVNVAADNTFTGVSAVVDPAQCEVSTDPQPPPQPPAPAVTNPPPKPSPPPPPPHHQRHHAGSG